MLQMSEAGRRPTKPIFILSPMIPLVSCFLMLLLLLLLLLLLWCWLLLSLLLSLLIDQQKGDLLNKYLSFKKCQKQRPFSIKVLFCKCYLMRSQPRFRRTSAKTGPHTAAQSGVQERQHLAGAQAILFTFFVVGRRLLAIPNLGAPY